ncbi:SDR family NAD(P)-dependent oxidoreductase [Streptomyces sp. NPDC020951]|uniref:SDR family NAD(P)-dependent oxidoreductase n=1 Tax=Streptomyces sp. NPDC020951 TaxID=3365104 RepID=UPI0037B5940E
MSDTSDRDLDEPSVPEGIAIIGMSGRFPGARDLSEFWANLRDGVESVVEFRDDELQAAGVDPEVFRQPHYVKAGPSFEGLDLFDAEFFGYTSREAKIMDPQHRLFLETAWAALEHAGHDPAQYEGTVGVFGGASSSAYIANVVSNMDDGEEIRGENVGLGNELAFLTTRVSYKLDLKGPSYPVQTACSSSLVALHAACQSLLDYECDMALSGGVSYKVQEKAGYPYQEGAFLSPDGHVRPFDAAARGTVFANGVGVVALKRLADAVADSDTVHAVIRGTAVNNDGAVKASFSAPSVVGQATVIAEALATAGLEPGDIDYVEAHGSGTLIGDSIEVQALSRAFSGAAGTWRIGSVKSNVGHLDAAAGMAGLLKTVLALRNEELPPSLNHVEGNGDIDFTDGPFRVHTELSAWPRSERVRRAGVSAFGFGGTNAHVVLEEAPPAPELCASPRESELLVVSARSEQALDEASDRLAAFLRRERPAPADAAFTLARGRRAFPYRRTVCGSDVDAMAAALESRDPAHVTSAHAEQSSPHIAFLFSGQGSQYPGMARGLYASEPVFRSAVDTCAELLEPLLDKDVRDVLFSPDAADTALLGQTRWAQPALFVVEYALVTLWQAWGVEPSHLLGHSLGEWVAACVSGVFRLEDALRLVALRGELMQSCAAGAMLGVVAERDTVEAALPDGVCLAAHNGLRDCVVSGPVDAVEKFAVTADERGWATRPLEVSHAFHSELMEPVVDAFVAAVGKVDRGSPGIPFVSNVTGDWITPEQARDPEYWGRQIRRCVEFAAGVRRLAESGAAVLLEVGPGQTLAGLARRTLAEADTDTGGVTVTASLPHRRDPRGAGETMRRTLGQLWLHGVSPDWTGYYGQDERRRIPLPTYPFERKRYWLEPVAPRTPREPGPHPLLDQVLLRSAGQSVFHTELSLERHWVLAEHRMLGEAIVPGTTYLEMCRAAATAHLGRPVTEIKDVDFLVPLLVQEQQPRTVHTTVRELGDDIVEFTVAGHDPARDVWTVHVQGTAGVAPLAPPPPQDPAALLARCDLETVDLGAAQAEHKVMEFGRRWTDSLRTMHVGVRAALGILDMPERYRAECEDHVLHPALLDLATGFSGFAVHESREDVREYRGSRAFFLPVGYDSLRIHAPLPPEGFSLITPHPESRAGVEVRKVDVTICDAVGNTAVEILGFTVKRVPDPRHTVARIRPHTRHHTLRWVPAPAVAEQREAPVAVLLVTEGAGLSRDLGGSLHSRGVRVITAELAEEWSTPGDDHYRVPPTTEGYERLLDALGDEVPGEAVVVAAPAADAQRGVGELDRRLRSGVESLFHLVRALAARDAVPGRLTVIAPCVARVTGDEPATAPVHATLFGLAKVIGQENEGTQVLCLDVEEDTDPAALCAELLGPWSPTMVALRQGRRHVPELAPVHLREQSRQEDERPDGVYLITGGLGGLGLAVARHLSLTVPGVRLALVGRSTPGPGEGWDATAAEDPRRHRQITALRELEAQGADVRCYRGDVAGEADMAEVVRAVRADLGRIECVIHAAGVAGDGFLFHKEAETFRSTLAPKVVGATVLDLVTADDPPQLMLTFGSTTSVFGVAGQGDYTAANDYLRHFADHRTALGRRTVTIDWTDWLDTGMAFDHGVQRDQGFFRSISVEDGLGSFDEILLAPRSPVIVGEINHRMLGAVDPDRLAAQLRRAPLVLEESVRRRVAAAGGEPRRGSPAQASTEPGADEGVTLFGRDDGGYSETEHRLARIWARELGLDRLNIHESSFSLGGDSLIALRMAQSIQKTMGVRVSMVDLFRYVTVADLAAHLDSRKSRG